tara:strand:+ start:1250 stop:1678 length:429 start_codon:yes stop_codon:yes gene_type:complete
MLAALLLAALLRLVAAVPAPEGSREPLLSPWDEAQPWDELDGARAQRGARAELDAELDGAMGRTASNVVFDHGTPNVTGGVMCGAYLIVSMERSGTTTLCDDINGLDEASANHVRASAPPRGSHPLSATARPHQPAQHPGKC